MTTTEYRIEVFAEPNDPRREYLAGAVSREIERLGLHHTVAVKLAEAPVSNELTVGVYFGNERIAQDLRTAQLVSDSLKKNRVVIPVVDDLREYFSSVPDCLRPINGFWWKNVDSSEDLGRKLLEELGIEDSQRRAFISHKRDDGMAAAEQLHDYLSHKGFQPFIDRFHISQGKDIQAEIADQLEDCAMLILLETPSAHTSDWVFYEVEYALSHNLGMNIISWPNVTTDLPGTFRLPRQLLEESDLVAQKGYDIFTSSAMDRIIAAVEAEHAKAMIHRRKYLLVSAEEAAKDAGRECLPLPGWRMMVRGMNDSSVVQVTPRLPTVGDLYALDQFCATYPGIQPGILVHAARRLPDLRKKVLAWAGESRDLALVPENAIGAYWGPDGT